MVGSLNDSWSAIPRVSDNLWTPWRAIVSHTRSGRDERVALSSWLSPVHRSGPGLRGALWDVAEWGDGAGAGCLRAIHPTVHGAGQRAPSSLQGVGPPAGCDGTRRRARPAADVYRHVDGDAHGLPHRFTVSAPDRHDASYYSSNINGDPHEHPNIDGDPHGLPHRDADGDRHTSPDSYRQGDPHRDRDPDRHGNVHYPAHINAYEHPDVDGDAHERPDVDIDLYYPSGIDGDAHRDIDGDAHRDIDGDDAPCPAIRFDEHTYRPDAAKPYAHGRRGPVADHARRRTDGHARPNVSPHRDDNTWRAGGEAIDLDPDAPVDANALADGHPV